MTVTLSIKNVPDDVAEALRLHAKANHRSLQGELLAIVEQAAARLRSSVPNGAAEVLARARARNLTHEGETSTEMIRRWRDRGYSYATNPNHHADTEADFGAEPDPGPTAAGS